MEEEDFSTLMDDDTVIPAEYDVAGVTYSSSLEEDLHIDSSNLNEAFAEHSSKFAWYATAYELALAYESRLKDELDMAYARLDVQARAQMENAGVKVTEKKVENTVITHPEYVSLRNQYRQAQESTGLLKAAKDAMIQRKDCLISLGANKRAEFASDPSLLQDQYKNKYGKNFRG